jgi:hypothetical protein
MRTDDLFGIQRPHPHREQDVGASLRHFEFRRQDAGNGHGLIAVELEPAAHDVRVGAETACPEAMADQGNRRRATQAIVRCEVASGHDLDAENAQQAVLHQCTAESFRLFFGDVTGFSTPHRRHGFEGLRRGLPLLDVHAIQQHLVSQRPIRQGERHPD